MKEIIDYKNWNRKEHFEWFNEFDEPFFGIVSEIDCTNAYLNSKKQNIPFYHNYLHKSLKAVNLIPEFRLRIEDNNVVSFDKIHASTTLGRTDNTYSMSFIEYNEDLSEFSKAMQLEEKRIKNSKGLGVDSNTMRKNVIHYSSVPWFKITGLSHARNFKFKDSVPKITFGKFEIIANKKIMNIAINAHHGLMDGYHVGIYLKTLQELLHSK
jgi:chloramphenicol O-acetyltransferase type A